jgi:tRNA (cytidine/uridine-2'-O-)-methyltransferase
MLNIALYQPEIPPNTGNIIRLCANSGAQLHLIEPLGFKLEEKSLRRAGLDYHQWAKVACYKDYQQFIEKLAPQRLWAISTKGRKLYTDVSFQSHDTLLFGPETRGLPESLLATMAEHTLRIPMAGNSRSLNLANAVAIVTYEAWRQLGFKMG